MNCKITLRNGGEFKYEPLVKLEVITFVMSEPELVISGYPPPQSLDVLNTSRGLIFDRFTFDNGKTSADPIKVEFY